ncbi:hypothetical protein CEXT_260761 [Caerostris extrusa]|uniref:Uncharacterized protein n=1 Tax=Caerostris extrusa TaxID=172846 RepID=A0AAV4Y3U9_CAEEX|nr:hypothetical protein CEXT_260761 [Caerostris extrusa]
MIPCVTFPTEVLSSNCSSKAMSTDYDGYQRAQKKWPSHQDNHGKEKKRSNHSAIQSESAVSEISPDSWLQLLPFSQDFPSKISHSDQTRFS